MGRGISWVVVVASAQLASAQPKPDAASLIGAQPVLTVSAPTGFIDDVVAIDGDRVGYVIADGVNAAALHIATVGKTEEQIVDISTITLQPTTLTFVGARMFVVGASEGKQVAALVELSDKKKQGTALYRVAAADHITVITRDGKQRIAVHRQAEMTGSTTHTIELLALENGKRVAQGKPLVVDASGHDKKLDFRVNHWSDGFTRAYGIKAGEWDRKENQKAPDQEGTYDLVTGKLTRKKIDDLFEQKRRFAALADAALDQKFSDYDPKSLQGFVNADGTGWLALKVDPVNADAVARKRADPEYLDIFKIADGKAVRKARLLAKGVRHRFGPAGEQRFWLVERNAGFERGGKTLTLYQLQ
jgi:hypothetical protein